MSVKVHGCTLCDRLRKGDRKVKASRNPRVHWVQIGQDRKDNTWGQRPCRKYFAKPSGTKPV